MNGVKSISMRKGYLFTALAAAVLLAASSGTALAQVTITGPAMDTVNEGETATYAVAVKGFIAPGASADTFTVTLGNPSPDTTDTGTAGENPGDVNQNLGATYTVAVPAGPEVGAGVVAVGVQPLRLHPSSDEPRPRTRRTRSSR